jgi:hypothetical protein
MGELAKFDPEAIPDDPVEPRCDDLVVDEVPLDRSGGVEEIGLMSVVK